MKIFMRLVISASFVSLGLPALAVLPDQKNLPINLAPHELPVLSKDIEAAGVAPQGPIHSLAEWESSDAVMTLWNNSSWVRALANHGAVKLLGDDDSAIQYWRNWLGNNNISESRVSYYKIPTDSIWIRDYGPWFIVDGAGSFGIVDTTYNRPRPQDDKVPDAIGKILGVPVYKPGLIHTGGNYYSDGTDNAFSSTLVYTENSSLSATEVLGRMKSFLGIDRYTTSPLAPRITIEHMDTFGKLVAPDTWVFSEFPAGSRFKKDSDTMVALLKTLKSPYGTPYKIFRMPMSTLSGTGETFKAYINSFISNRTLYFPNYNVPSDATAKEIYQAALPAYEIVGVDAMGTEWGDSVHCRSRNLLSRNTIFIFPKVKTEVLDSQHDIIIEAEIFASPGATLNTPVIQWSVGNHTEASIALESVGNHVFRGLIPAQRSGDHVAFHIEASDSSGKSKTAPIAAPTMRIELDIK